MVMMWKKLEAFLFGRRWKRDEHAWRVWLGIEPLIPASFPEVGEHRLMAGRVTRVYQRAHRGTKAVVDFGPVVGVQDTWSQSAQIDIAIGPGLPVLDPDDVLFGMGPRAAGSIRWRSAEK
jgi:hypothetical protein